eukprot:scaffold249373_cov118-Cyclotella_meneghiniana.AAC.8
MTITKAIQNCSDAITIPNWASSCPRSDEAMNVGKGNVTKGVRISSSRYDENNMVSPMYLPIGWFSSIMAGLASPFDFGGAGQDHAYSPPIDPVKPLLNLHGDMRGQKCLPLYLKALL